MLKTSDKFKSSIALLLAVSVVSVSAASFEDLTKSFIVLQSSTGKEYLCAAVKMDGGNYAVTSQSLFLDPIPKFRLKSFSGKALNQSGFDISKLGDFVRIKLEDNAEITALDPAGDGGGGKKVYSMNPVTGIVHCSNAGGGNLITKDFNCTAGSPVINDKGQFVGVSSRTDDGFGNNAEIKVAVMEKGEKWEEDKPGLCAKQIYSIEQLRVFTKALNHTRDNNKQNQFLEINEDTHPKLLLWLKDQNKQAFNDMLAKKVEKGSGGKAMREHASRCFYYSGLKRLAAFYSSNSQTAKKARWKSNYQMQMGKKIFDENNASAKKIRTEMQKLVERYPSIKAKF